MNRSSIESATDLGDAKKQQLLAEFDQLEAGRLKEEEESGVVALTEEAARWWRDADGHAAAALSAPSRSLEDLHAKAALGLALAEVWTPNTEPQRVLGAIARDIGLMIREYRRAPAGLLELHREWSGLKTWYDTYHNLGGWHVRSQRKRYKAVLGRLEALEDAIALAEIAGPVSMVVKLDVGLGEFAASILCGGGFTLEIFTEGAFGAAVGALEALAARTPDVAPWTLKARQMAIQRLAVRQTEEVCA
ncbi:hypothetical protein [Azospirillum sp. sgz302134]